MTRVPQSQVSRWPWRYRCPEGHSSVDLGKTVFRCEQCSVSYPKSEMQDLAAEQASADR